MADETKEEVAEEATSETNKEAVEQRTDDYEALANRLGDVFEKISSIGDALEKLTTKIDAVVNAISEAPEAVELGEDEAPDAVVDVDLETPLDELDFTQD